MWFTLQLILLAGLTNREVWVEKHDKTKQEDDLKVKMVDKKMHNTKFLQCC